MRRDSAQEAEVLQPYLSMRASLSSTCDVSSHPVQNNENISSFSNGFVRVNEAARFLGISIGRLRNLTSNGDVPFYKLGRSVLYRLHELELFVLNQKET